MLARLRRVWRAGFLARARIELSELAELGRLSKYALNSSSEYMLQGSAFIEPGDPDDTKNAKRSRAKITDYVSTLSNLTPREFESMCAQVLHHMGVKDPVATRYSGEEGTDFFGRLRLNAHVLRTYKFPGVEKQHTSGRVSTPEIRDLVGAVELAIGGAYGSAVSPYPDLRLRVCDPIFYLFFTTGQISSNSWRLLERSGVIAMDGEMVAAFLVDREVALANGKFDIGQFGQWVQVR